MCRVLEHLCGMTDKGLDTGERGQNKRVIKYLEIVTHATKMKIKSTGIELSGGRKDLI